MKGPLGYAEQNILWIAKIMLFDFKKATELILQLFFNYMEGDYIQEAVM